MRLLFRRSEAGPVATGIADGDVWTWDAATRTWGPKPASGNVTSVFGRTGAVLAQLGDYTSSLVTNLSTVAGATVTDALTDIDGALLAIETFLAGLAASDVQNDSTVSGATVQDALDWLKANGGGAAVGTFAARPAPGSAGQQYFATDGVIGQWVSDGTLWRPMIAGVLGYEVPSLADFNAAGWTTFNAGGISVAGHNGGLMFQGVTDATIHNRGWALTVPSVGDVEIELCLEDMSPGFAGGGRTVLWGCGLRNSVSANSFVLSFAKLDDFSGTTGFLDLSTWSDDNTRTSFSQPRFSANGNGTGGPLFLRARRTGANFDTAVSLDRKTWVEVSNGAATFTADQVIIATDVINGPAIPQFMVLSLRVTP